MVDLPMMGRAGMSQADYFPPAPQQQGAFGSLGGLGRGVANFANSPGGNDLLQSMFMSMMTSPSNAPLAAMPEIMGGLQQQRFQQQKYDEELQERQRERQEAATKENRTVAWIKSNFPEMGDDQALAAATNPAILQHLMKQQQGGRDTTFGLNPIYGQDADGNTVMGVLGNDGTFKPVDTGGVTLSTGVDRVDVGTHYNLLDKRTGQVVGTLPKDNYTPERDRARGTSDGKAYSEDLALYQSMTSKMPGLMETVGRLEELADKATYTYAGNVLDGINRQMGWEPREEALAKAEYIAIIDNQILPLLRDTFGAQFTLEEGNRLRATLGNENLSPAEKKATLRAFIAQKERDIQALALRTIGGGSSSPQAPQADGRRTSTNIPWSIEE